MVMLLLPLLLAFSYGPYGYPPHGTRPPEDVLIWETIGNPDSMDPAVDNEQFGQWALSNIYETLYTYPFNGSATAPLIPLLADQQPSISADGKNYTIGLRQGITFHDGTPFNASCVKWNIERAMKIFSEWGKIWTIAEVLKGGAQVMEAALSNGTSSLVFIVAFDDWVANSTAIEVLDDYTVRFVLERPFSPFITVLATGVAFIMSPTYAIIHASTQGLATWEAYGVDYGESENYMRTHTCGTGPYTLTNWIEDQYIELDVYDDYWRGPTTTSDMLPPSYAGSIKKVYIRTNEDFNGRWLNLLVGVTDGADWTITDASEIRNETVFYEIYASTGGYQYTTVFFGFNMGNFTTTIDSSNVTTESPFKNKNFRRTASYAFDYQEFIEDSAYGFGTQGKGPIPIGMTGHNGSSFVFDYNITAAVKEWNLAIQDPAFLSSLNAINSTLTFHYIAGSTPRNASVDLLKQGLDAAYWHPAANHTGLSDNLTIRIEAISFSTYLEYITGGRLLILPFGWTPDNADPISYLYPLCYSEEDLARRIGYNNTDIDLWCELAISETNSSERQVYLDHIQDTIADEAPYLWAYQELEFRTWRDWVSGDGLIFNPMRDVYFYHIIKVYPNGYSPIAPPYPYFGLVGIIVPLGVVYVVVNNSVAPSLKRKNTKFVLFLTYTGLNLFFTAQCIVYLEWLALLFLASTLLFLLFSYGLLLLWLLWYVMYCDYKKERETTKATLPAIDLQ